MGKGVPLPCTVCAYYAKLRGPTLTKVFLVEITPSRILEGQKDKWVLLQGSNEGLRLKIQLPLRILYRR